MAVISHGAPWKYCRVCERLKPFEAFDRHTASSRGFRSGRQLECKACKKLVNAVLNPLRTRDQHRESSDRRRLYGLLAGGKKLNEGEVYRRFDSKCFNCGKQLARGEGSVDHTLPAKLLWSLSEGRTLLCHDCNGAKAEHWPSQFYKRDAINVDTEKLRKLSVLTGIPYELLAGPPRLNPDAVKWLENNMDEFLVRWIKYPEEIKRIRKIVKDMERLDIFAFATTIPPFLRDEGEQ